MCKGSLGPHAVDAGQKAADPFQDFTVVQFGWAATAARADAETKVAEVVQSVWPCGELALQRQWADHRNFRGHQLGGKRMLFQNLGIAPAPGSVELGDNLGAIL